eukprot:TRINITY_DN28083_c0_g1_i1.p1 TRINITY_DN28083_c0_g1~~TRINITY_DN28083_c0_g1_i1.p1  ORF type:complete len:415 (-),score=81.07 TRINITY_DN28083_c0_g1_i1:114-1358(-)
MGAACPACFEGVAGASSSVSGPSKELREAACQAFSKAFDGKAAALGIAPGRLEVLGNHTDYNEGFILASAVDRYVVLAGRRTNGTTCNVASVSFREKVSFDSTNPQPQSGDKAWANYVAGVVSELNKLKVKVGGFDALVTSNLPHGAGVSSSAALEMATAKLLARLYPESVGRVSDLDLIKVSKAAENNFVGMGCGILDQFSSGKGRSGQLLFLDCRSLEYGYAPFKGAQFVLANTNAPHALVDGQYDELRRRCFGACEKVKQASGKTSITHLRDVDRKLFENHLHHLDEDEKKRAKHILGENERVHIGMDALKAGDMKKLGECMSQSHLSSQYDFGNSCKELDIMAECAKGIDGFLGGRLMGGGFGGSTINLVEEGKGESFAAELSKRYEAKTGIKSTTFVCKPGDGAYSEAV